jgi:hypothetical protein
LFSVSVFIEFLLFEQINDIRIPFTKGSLDDVETDGTGTQDDGNVTSQSIYAKEEQ